MKLYVLMVEYPTVNVPVGVYGSYDDAVFAGMSFPYNQNGQHVKQFELNATPENSVETWAI